MSHPLWVRGLKSHSRFWKRGPGGVAPLVGAWIEMIYLPYVGIKDIVAPLVGAWIEISK